MHESRATKGRATEDSMKEGKMMATETREAMTTTTSSTGANASESAILKAKLIEMGILTGDFGGDTFQSEVTETVETTTVKTGTLQHGTAATVAVKTTNKKKNKRSTEWILRNTGEELHAIYLDAIEPDTSEISWNKEPELLCSYNWQETSDDTNIIYVPGGPPRWTPRTLPHTLTQDAGFHWMDLNHARQPRFPYDPMFRALDIMNPNMKLTDVDVIADRNNLRTLLEFCQGKSVGPFRLDLHLTNNTLILVRKEERFSKRADGKGYGYNFEESFTTPAPGLEDATNHYRVIRYAMGPLNVVVRLEVDAYFEESDPTEIPPDEAEENTTSYRSNHPEVKPWFNFKGPLQVFEKGHVVPNSNMAELKTKVFRPDLEKHSYGLPAAKDQLWFGRTPHLIVGYYTAETGVFHRIRHMSGKELCATWETSMQEPLRKLVSLLAQVRDMLRAEPGPFRSAVLVREEKGGPIRIRAMEEQHRVFKQSEHFHRYFARAPRNHPQQFTSSRGRGNNTRGRGRGNFPPQSTFPMGRGNGPFESAAGNQYAVPSGYWNQLREHGNGSNDRRGGNHPPQGNLSQMSHPTQFPSSREYWNGPHGHAPDLQGARGSRSNPSHDPYRPG